MLRRVAAPDKLICSYMIFQSSSRGAPGLYSVRSARFVVLYRSGFKRLAFDGIVENTVNPSHRFQPADKFSKSNRERCSSSAVTMVRLPLRTT